MKKRLLSFGIAAITSTWAALMGSAAEAQQNCHSSYQGACLDEPGDYDCAGGSGDGPNYVQTAVRVVGPDEFDLDRDGDGVGCQELGGLVDTTPQPVSDPALAQPTAAPFAATPQPLPKTGLPTMKIAITGMALVDFGLGLLLLGLWVGQKHSRRNAGAAGRKLGLPGPPSWPTGW